MKLPSQGRVRWIGCAFTGARSSPRVEISDGVHDTTAELPKARSATERPQLLQCPRAQVQMSAGLVAIKIFRGGSCRVSMHVDLLRMLAAHASGAIGGGTQHFAIVHSCSIENLILETPHCRLACTVTGALTVASCGQCRNRSTALSRKKATERSSYLRTGSDGEQMMKHSAITSKVGRLVVALGLTGALVVPALAGGLLELD
jgi:hypothetical protein